MGIKRGQVCLRPAKWEKSHEAKASSKAWLSISSLLFLLIFHRSHSLYIYKKATKTAARNSNVMGIELVFLSTLNLGSCYFDHFWVCVFQLIVFSVWCLKLSECPHTMRASLGPHWAVKKTLYFLFYQTRICEASFWRCQFLLFSELKWYFDSLFLCDVKF